MIFDQAFPFIRRALLRHAPAQVALLFLCWFAGLGVVRLTGIPLPPGVIGLFLLLTLLAAGVISLPSMRRGAYWMLGEMMAFFVPASLCVIDHPEFFDWLGVKLLAVIIIGNFAVLGVTAVVVTLFLRNNKGDSHA